MKIAISGSENFVGTCIVNYLRDFSSEIFLLNEYENEERWKDIISESDVVINLSGSPIFGRWTNTKKKQIRDTRIEPTKRIVTILNELSEASGKRTFIAASTTGIYPEDKVHTFSNFPSQKENSFLAEITAQWEAEVDDIVNPSVRVIVARLGVILCKEGGMLKSILPAFKRGFGYTVGNGKQMLSFVHIKDVANAIKFFITNDNISGFYNIVAPAPISNDELTKTIAKKLHRPRLLKIPPLFFKLALGESANILLNEIKIYPKELLSKKFEFEYPTFEKSIDEILNINCYKEV